MLRLLCAVSLALALGACAEAGGGGGGGGGGADGGSGSGRDAGQGPSPLCGNGVCGHGEECENCPADCGSCDGSHCGDSTCDVGGGECTSCSLDCGGSCGGGGVDAGTSPVCGDGSCTGAENSTNCAQDCGGNNGSCGDGSCSGGETCSSCASDCGTCPPVCGDGACNGGETQTSCPGDCGGGGGNTCGDFVCATDGSECLLCIDCLGNPLCCGDGFCELGEDSTNCLGDCPDTGGGQADCSHDVCTIGTPLLSTCGTCEAAMCDFDNFCCTDTWDDLCVSQVPDICGQTC
jgi:hypothetical protein